MEFVNQQANSDERMLAGLAHLFGLIVALIIFATQKDESKFVRFQALQAAAFDLLAIVVMLVLVGCSVGLMVLMTFGSVMAVSHASSTQDVSWLIPLTSAMPFAVICLILPVSLLLLVARILATVKVFNGQDYHFPWLGNRVEAYLKD